MQNQPSMAVCIYSDIYAGIGWVINIVLRTSKLLPKVTKCINIFLLYMINIFCLFDLNIIMIRVSKHA